MFHSGVADRTGRLKDQTHRVRKEQFMVRRSIVLSLALAAFSLSSSRGDVVPIDPFDGAMSENFDSFSEGGGLQELVIFGGFATVRNQSPDGAIKVEYYSSRGGIVVVPHSQPLMMGQMGIMLWEFEEPVTQFGSYFANNSRFDDAQVDFYDENGDWIDSTIATIPNTGSWYWNGWESDVPIKWIIIAGNDEEFNNAFIWVDDAQIN
jgi:hypothetical protein